MYNGHTIILEMKKTAKIKRGLTVVFNIDFYNESDEYIKEFIKEKLPNWELVSIIIKDDGE